MEGMDIAAVEAIGTNLGKQGELIGNIVNAINSLVSNAEQNWKGPDATKFQSNWEGQYKSALMAAKTEIDGLGTTAKKQAADQQAASAN